MNQVTEFFSKLFSSADWPPRWHCGQWTAFHGWLYIISDLLIWSAYFTIPIVILWYISKKQGVRFLRLYFLFAAFILACGATHLLDAIAFWIPLYRLNALMRFITGVVSWITVFYLVKYLPVLFSLKTMKALEAEIELCKKEEEKLKKAKNDFQLLVSSVKDYAIFLLDKEGRVASWNTGAESIKGYTADEIIGKPMDIFYTTEEIKNNEPQINLQKAREQGSFETESLRVRKDGSIFYANIVFTSLVDEKGELLGYAKVTKDITKSKKAEQDLINANQELLRSKELLFQSEEREKWTQELAIVNKELAFQNEEKEKQAAQLLIANKELLFQSDEKEKRASELSETLERIGFLASIADNIQDPVISTDNDANITRWNKATEILLEWKSDEVIGGNVTQLLRPNYVDKGDDLIFDFLKIKKSPWQGEVIYHSKSGRPINVLITASSLKDAEANIIGHLIVARDITDRKKAENELSKLNHDLEERIRERTKKLHESELRYRSLIEQASDAIFIVDSNMKYLDINTAGCLLTGYSREEFLKLTRFDLVFKEDLAKNPFSMERLKVGQSIHYEMRLKRKDGTAVQMGVSAKLMEDKRLVIFARDITEKKEWEIKLMASEIRYRRLFESAQDGIIILDGSNGVIVDINPYLIDLLNYSYEEFQGKHLWEIGLFKDIVANKESFLKLKQKGYVRYDNLPLKTKAGNAIWVEFVSNEYKEDEEYVIQCNVRDITERKLAEQAIEETLNEKNIILESIGDAFFAVDKNWKVTYWNQVAETSLLVRKHEIMGKNLWEIFSDSIDSLSYKKYHDAMATNHIVHFEDYYSSLHTWFEISAYPSEHGLSVYFNDVTERKKAAEEITKLNAELEERVLTRTRQLKKSVDEMEAFSYSVSHDLRAPLRGIIGFANILEEDHADKLDEEAKRITTIIKRNTVKMGLLIDDLLAFSRTGRQELLKTEIDINKIVGEILTDQGLNGQYAKIKWVIHPLPFIKADSNMIKQVWINLISNAVKYSNKAKDPSIEIGSIEEKNSITFFVKDNGVGFDEKYKAKLFKVFQRLHTSQEFEGTGIGLAIVEKIVSRHGGTVWAEGKLNKGAAFYFSLPVDHPEQHHININ